MQQDPLDYQKRSLIERLRRRRAAAALVIMLENASLALWRPVFWCLLFAGLWLLEVPGIFGKSGPGVFLPAFIAGLGWFLFRDLRRYRRPGTDAIDRRLEKESHLPHRPLALLEDRLANPHAPAARSLWDKSREASFGLLAALRLPRPQPLIAQADRFALRMGVLLLLFTGIVAAGPQAPQRIMAGLMPYAFSANGAQAENVTLWITPPEYTGLPRLVVQGGGRVKEPVSIPAGSQFKVRIASGIGHPYLHMAGMALPLQRLDRRNWGLEGIVAAPTADQDNKGALKIRQWGVPRLSVPYAYIDDQPPIITLEDAPEALPKGQSRFKIKLWDDYGVTALSMRIALDPSIGEGPLGGPYEETRPLMAASGKEETIEPAYDTSWHTWAGLPVVITFEAQDHSGHAIAAPPLHMTLPERAFTHPVAQKLIGLRKRLAWTPMAAAGNASIEMEKMLESYKDFSGDKTAFLSLRSMSSRLRLNPGEKTAAAIIPQMWDTALKIEDGNLTLAGRNLRDAQQALQNLLSDPKAKPEDIAKAMENLREAMAEYFQEMMREMDKRMAEGHMPDLPPEMFAQEMNTEDLAAFLDQMQAQALSGDKDAARQMLSQLQKMMEQLDPNMSDAMKPPPEMQFMMKGVGELQKLIERQQALLDRIRELAEDEPRAPQGYPEFLPFDEDMMKKWGDGSLPPPPQKNAGKKDGLEKDKPALNTKGQEEEQEALRRMLGELMAEAGRQMGAVPGNMKTAEMAMREAAAALGENSPSSAIPHQEKALEELRKSMEQMNQNLAAMMKRMTLLSFGQPRRLDPLGRPLQEGDGPSWLPGNKVKIPDQGDRKRVQDIQKELREKSGQFSRPDYELDYFRRLLRQF